MEQNKEQLVIETASPEETESVGRMTGESAGRGLFVGLRGDLGAGKTVMVRGIARGLGIDGHITSPTFQLVREYQGRETLFHYDFYRMESTGEVVDLDISDHLATGVVAAEWSDKFTELGGEDRIVFSLAWTGETSRRIAVLEATGAGADVLDVLKEKWGRA